MNIFQDIVCSLKRKLKDLLTGESILNLLCLCMKWEGIYPLGHNSTTIANFLHRFVWCFYFVNNMLLIAVIMHTFYFNSDNVPLICTLCMDLYGCIDTIVILILFRINEHRVKYLLLMAEDLFCSKKPSITLKSRNVYLITYTLMALVHIPILYMYLMRRKTSKDSVIMAARYPFPLDSFILKVVLAFHQLIVISTNLVPLVSDGVAGLLMYMCTLRLKLLEMNINMKDSSNDFKNIILEHQKILLLINEMNELVKIISLKDIISYMAFTITVGLVVLQENMTILSSQIILYFWVIIMVTLKLFLFTESGEYLTISANDIATATYFSEWYEEKSKNITLKTIVILRCQRESKIYISGFLTALNRKLMTVVLYSTFSYFMAIKLIVYQ